MSGNILARLNDTLVRSVDCTTMQDQQRLKNLLVAFIDTLTVSTGKSTFYATGEDLEAAQEKIHSNIFSMNRGIYTICLVLNGITPNSLQLGILNLLGSPWNASTRSIIPMEFENIIIDSIISGMRPNVGINTFTKIRNKSINRKEVRRKAVAYVLRPDNIEFRAVKYRKKLRKILHYGIGQDVCHKIKSVLDTTTDAVNPQERIKMFKTLAKYAGRPMHDFTDLYTVSFILGNERLIHPELKLLRAYINSKTNLSEGAKLPSMVLEGIRGTYHPNVPKDKVLELTRNTMSAVEAKNVQAKAASTNTEVDVNWDSRTITIVDAYIYLMKRRGDISEQERQNIFNAISRKAIRAAQHMPARYKHISIVSDFSRSMAGSEEQPNRPIAIIQAIRAILMNITDTYENIECGGTIIDNVVYPEGNSRLAYSVAEAFLTNPDAVYILSDGYENRASGRVNETMSIIRNRLNIDTPVFHINPVQSSETKLSGIRNLSEYVSTLPVNSEEFGIGFIRAAIEQDLKTGLGYLVSTVRPMIEASIINSIGEG